MNRLKGHKANPLLGHLFNPNSIAVIGAREKPNTAGRIVFKNLLEGGYKGKLYAVNPRHAQIFNQKSYDSVLNIEQEIDLGIIVTPAIVVAEVLRQCAEKGIDTVIIISSGFKEIGIEGKLREEELKEIIQKYKIKVLGPNCLGAILPYINMNATFSNFSIFPGNVALISQSGALCATILDWANQQKIGFSSVISIGNAINIGFSELLSYLQSDSKTHCILMYIEGIPDPKNFLQNLSRCAQKKPVIILKAGLTEQSSHALLSHTGALIGKDDVFNAAIKHSGAIRVDTIQDFFNAAEIFSKNLSLNNNTLTIVSNGGGAGVIAADQAFKLKVNLLKFSENLFEKLNKILPAHCSHGNPIDIIGDASPERFEKTLNILLQEKECDAILVILVPVAMSLPFQTANIVLALAKKANKPILTCWMGIDQAQKSKELFHEHGIPSFETPEEAVQAFALLRAQAINQKRIIENESYQIIHNSFTESNRVNEAKNIMNQALLQNRNVLNLIESKAILKKFNISVLESYPASTIEEGIKIAGTLSYPIVMKILSPDITHKQDVGGVQLNITTQEALSQVFERMIKSAREKVQNARIEGVTIEKMVKHPNNRELMIGILRDPVFGSVVSFGAGGSIIDVMQDRAIALPPLSNSDIDNLISETRISKILGDFRGMPSIKRESLKEILLNVSNMACALPQIVEMDINPLIANEDEVIAVDARIVIDHNFEQDKQ